MPALYPRASFSNSNSRNMKKSHLVQTLHVFKISSLEVINGCIEIILRLKIPFPKFLGIGRKEIPHEYYKGLHSLCARLAPAIFLDREKLEIFVWAWRSTLPFKKSGIG